MAESAPQSYANHRRFVPGYHFGVFTVLGLNVIVALVGVVRGPSFASAFALLLAIALVGLFLYARLFPLAVQDRVIRLEERLRMNEVLPAELRPRIGELTREQLVGLRFASDAELEGLVRQALDEKLGREEIKKRVKDWRADDLRV